MLAHNQGTVLNASKLATAMAVSAPTVSSYVDLPVDLLLVRRLQPYYANIKKRLIKSPRTYVRDCGLLHALLGMSDSNALAGNPVVGKSWEGFVIESLLAVAPDHAKSSFYAIAAGAEIDLVLELGGNHGVWAIEVKRSLSAKLNAGFTKRLRIFSQQRRSWFKREVISTQSAWGFKLLVLGR